MAEKKENEPGPSKGLGALVTRFGSLLEKLNELAEQGGAQSTSGSFEAGEGKNPLKGIFGLSVKLGVGDHEMKIEPFGNLRRDQESGESVVDEVREPLVDVFDESEQVLIVAEMPGVESRDIHVEIDDGTLTLSAERGEKRYRKTLSVPRGTRREAIGITGQNGIVELRVPKSSGGRPPHGQ
jgi:HSP20 family protein